MAPAAVGQVFVSATGTFTSNNGQFYDFNFGVTQAGSPITIQTYSWSGGTNAAGQTITADGFDSILTLFNGLNSPIANNDDSGTLTRDSLISETGSNALAIDSYRVRLTNFSTAIGSGGWSLDLTSSGSTSFNVGSITGSGSAVLSTLVVGSSNPAVPAQVPLTSLANMQAANSITFAPNTNMTWSGSPFISAPVINFQGATLTASSAMDLSSGFLSQTTYNLSSGAVNANAGLFIQGTMNFNQTGGVLNAQRFFVGGVGSTAYSLSGGTLTVTQDSVIENLTGTTNIFNLNGGEWDGNSSNLVSVGFTIFSGTAIINVSAGTLNSPAGLSVNTSTGGFSNVTQTGGWVRLGGLALQGNGGTASYVLNGGTLIDNFGLQLNPGGTFQFVRGYLGFNNGFTANDGGPLGAVPQVNPLQTLAVIGQTNVPDFHSLTLAGGTLITGNFNVPTDAAFNFNSGTLIITGNSGYSLGFGGGLDPLPAALVLNPSQTFKVNTQLFMNAGSGVSVNVAGGRLDAGTLIMQGPVTVTAGAVNIGTLIQTVGQLTISGGSVGVGSLQINGSGPNVTVTGGMLAAGSIGLDGAMSVLGGSVGVFNGFKVNGQLYIGPSGVVNGVGSMVINGSTQMGGGIAQIGASNSVSLGSNGLLGGSGVLLASSFVNGGTVRAGTGDVLRFGLGNMTNNNLFDLEGGRVSFEDGGVLTNSGSGLISGHGEIDATSGIINAGTVALSGGNSDIHGTLTQNSGGKVIVTGGSTSTFYNPVTNNAGSEFRVSTGSEAVFLGAVSGSGSFSGQGVKIFEGGGTLGPVDTVVGSSIVSATTSLTAARFREASLEVDGTTHIASDGTANGTSKVNTLNIAGSTDNWAGKLDLSNNDLVIDYSGTSPFADVVNQIKTGRNGGAWNGNGITSSAGDATHHTLGYAENSALGYSTFSGQPVDSTSVLVKYTWYGDSNLDGIVDIKDLMAMALHYNTIGDLWTTGDYNNDGAVNVADLTLLALNWQAGVGAPLGPSVESALAAMGLPAPAIPEPISLLPAGVALGIVSLRGRRSRGRGDPVFS